MNKYILVTGGLILFVVVGFPLLAFLLKLFFYFADLNHFKTGEAKDRALEYVEEKYDEEFVVTHVEYSKPLGEEGSFRIDLQSEQKPHLVFWVGMSSDLSNPDDNYKQELWNVQSNEWITPYILESFPESTKIISRISFDYTFHDLFTEHDSFNEIIESNEVDVTYLLTLVIFKDEVNIKEESQKLFNLWQTLQSKKFDHIMLDVRYTSTDFKKKDYENLDYSNFTVSLDTRFASFKPILKSEDIESRFNVREK
ncbi:hypothetical protein JOC85_000657 [Bacillus mesophilus]|uniref:Uncharacterized protein n=1 Tax=Bacillus mesophilus TaxID=1808955 RepID=A0A6M0Q4M8_9BACI|nr:hypothetical protein [Bacillus mesophilus]MBM7659890.1 hypothetical protein [Bacillus mesophilus]NEY70749.1 hypothetical protein [Bacillus mesophilus]